MITPSSIGLPPKFTHFRPEVRQEEIIYNIATSTTRFNILLAPPGVGKTIIASSVGLIRGDRQLYLTKSKSLQSQLHNDMHSIGLIDIVGHSNYSCANVKYDPTGEMADLMCEARRSPNLTCQYYNKVLMASITDFVSTNYAHWTQLYKSGDPDRLGTFTYLICDEAHNIASGSCLLGDLVSIKLYNRTMEQWLDRSLPKNLTIDQYIDWSHSALVRAKSKRQEIENRRYKDQRDILAITRIVNDLTRLITESSTAGFVVLPSSYDSVQFKPTNIAQYTEPYLFRSIDSILLCSATIFREDAALLGIKDEDVTFHEVSSSFSHKRRPFIYYPTSPPIKCDRNMSYGEKQVWINQLDRIMSVEPGKGIIQSRSYDRAEEITRLSKKHNQILLYDRSSAREVIERFRQSYPPCTLIGPTVEEGEDFPDDLCSYVIWPKVPFLNTKEPFTAAMQKIDKEYANREVCRSLVQGSLRGMRHEKDWCRIWMIDKHWGHFRLQPYFFGWFRRAFMMIRGLSEMPLPPQ